MQKIPDLRNQKPKTINYKLSLREIYKNSSILKYNRVNKEPSIHHSPLTIHHQNVFVAPVCSAAMSIIAVSSSMSLSSLPLNPTDLKRMMPFLSITNLVGMPSTLNSSTTLLSLSSNTWKLYLL